MKKQLSLLLLFVALSATSVFAQNNQIKADIEFEDAEEAFQNKDYQKTIQHLNEAEKQLGHLTAKTAYLKIIVLDKILDYEKEWDNNTAELYRVTKEYLKNAAKNPDKVDREKMRDVYEIEKRIDGALQIKEWREDQDYKNGEAAYEKENYEEAINWYRKAIEKENAYAMGALAWYYRFGKGVTQDYIEAMNWYKKAADKGNATAMTNVGYMYDEGKGVTQNYAEAMNWYKKAADKGNATAMNNVGYMYREGKGVAQNYTEAMNWYKKAADKGYPSAMYNIGHMYYKGQGVTQNYTEAMNWYKKAADKGNVNSMERIGGIYLEGHGVSKDHKEALSWFKKAYDAGHFKTSSYIGYIYQEGGFGVSQDYQEAIKWYEKSVQEAVELELGLSMVLIAQNYFKLKNYSKSMEWYKKAYVFGTDKQKEKAKGWISRMYQEGLGVPKDKKLAKEWLNK